MRNRFIAAIFVFTLFFAFSAGTFAAVPDFEKWNQTRLFGVLDSGTDSNSDYTFICLRTDSDEKAHQIHFLVMGSMKEFNGEDKTGVKITFGNIGTVELFADGRTDYDSSLFFAGIDNILSDEHSKDIWFELTVGIKAGIPEENIIELSLYDSNGIISNTYTVDISENSEDEITEKTAGTEKSSKTQKTKTAGTSKVRTTKTTKSKTSKSAKTRTSKNQNDEYVYESEAVYASAEDFEDTESADEKHTLIIISAAAVIACAAGGCAAGIINGRKKNSRGDK